MCIGCSCHVQVMILFFATFLGTIGPLNTWNTIGYQQVAARSNITGSLPGALHASLTPLIDYVRTVLCIALASLLNCSSSNSNAVA